MAEKTIDRSDAADARRLRWILDGNGYFLEEIGLCGHDDSEVDEAIEAIDAEIAAAQRYKDKTQ